MIDPVKQQEVYVGRIDLSTACDDSTELNAALRAVEEAASTAELKPTALNIARVFGSAKGSRYYVLLQCFKKGA